MHNIVYSNDEILWSPFLVSCEQSGWIPTDFTEMIVNVNVIDML